MAVTFNPSITNYKPSFSGKQKAPVAHVNLATGVDSLSIAAKPVVKNTLGHRLRNLAFGAMTLASTAFMGASCQDPKPPIVNPPDTTINYTDVEVPKTVNEMFVTIGAPKYGSKANECFSQLTLFNERNNRYYILDFDYNESGFDSLTINERSVQPGLYDTSYISSVVKSDPSELTINKFISNPTFTERIYAMNGTESVLYSTDKKSIINKINGQPTYDIKKESDNLMRSTYLLGSTVEEDYDYIRVIDAKFTNAPNFKKACQNAASSAIETAKITGKKAIRNIR